MAAAALSLTGKRVFISYPRGGRTHSIARQVEQGLRAAGAEVFRDESNIAPGDPDAIARLEQALGRSDVLAYLHGADTPDCDWQRKEVLYALRDGTPLVVAQTHVSPLALEVLTTQPVAATDDLSSWLPLMVEALGRAERARPRFAVNAEIEPSAQAVRDYLLHGLSSEWSDRVARYVPLAGRHQRTAQPQARRKHLLHDARFLLTLAAELGMTAAGAEPDKEPFSDVLALYQRLLAHRQRPRLAVLGEPGAGKSFSLQRLFCALAEMALGDAQAPVPLLLELGNWTRADMRMDAFVDRQLRRWGLDAHWRDMRDAGRAVLLLDGLNEIPVGQRSTKTAEVFETVQDSRWAGVLLSCRERDFTQRPLDLPMDQVRLAPLDEVQILDFLRRWAAMDLDEAQALEVAEHRFWALAAGAAQAEAARGVWQTWADAGATWQQFWSCKNLPEELPEIHRKTSGEQDQLWRQMRDDDRSLLRLARSPFWLEMLAQLPQVPDSKARLFELFLRASHEQGRQRCEQRQAIGEVPTLERWLHVLRVVALDLQRWHSGDRSGPAAGGDGAQTRLDRSDLPQLTDMELEFSIAVQVLKESDGQVGFTHQLMQETLASQALLRMALEDSAWPVRLEPTWFWPASGWWIRNGWEVVAELAGESVAHRPEDALRLVAWLARAQPEVAAQAWAAAGQPALPAAMAASIQSQWAPGLTTAAQAIPETRLEARSALARGLGRMGLDARRGVGLRPDGLPDIDWVRFGDAQPFVYQGQPHPPLPAFDLARYPVTHVQFQAFVEDGGYAPGAPWWDGLAQRFDAPADAAWTEPNAPRETVSWGEAVAFCRWLSHRLGETVRLPTEQQWERAAAGTAGHDYPWGADWDATRANAEFRLGRTCAVGLLPEGATVEGQVHDLSGNVWEWCLNEYEAPDQTGEGGDALRVLRGVSWSGTAGLARASYRNYSLSPGYRLVYVGFRVCRASPI